MRAAERYKHILSGNTLEWWRVPRGRGWHRGKRSDLWLPSPPSVDADLRGATADPPSVRRWWAICGTVTYGDVASDVLTLRVRWSLPPADGVPLCQRCIERERLGVAEDAE